MTHLASTWPRGLLERIKDIEDEELDRAYRAIALLVIFRLRTHLKPFNLRRHRVEVQLYNGQPVLCVGDVMWFDLRPGSKVTDALIAAGAAIDHGHGTWARKLVGINLKGE